MIPDYLIIEDELRRERDKLSPEMPLHAPMPLPPLPPEEAPGTASTPESNRGAWIVDLDDFSVVRL